MEKGRRPKMFWKRIIKAVFLATVLASCQAVESYQKTFLNDDEMKVAGQKTEVFDNFQVYREGAAGGIDTGGTGGGCGCN